MICAFSKKTVEGLYNWEITGIYITFCLHSFEGMREKKLLGKTKLAIFLKSNEKELHFLAEFQNLYFFEPEGKLFCETNLRLYFTYFDMQSLSASHNHFYTI